MSKFFGIVTLAIGGIIIADVLIHPQGTAAAASGVSNIQKPWLNALLGTPTK
jgi:hypothetical protein